MVGPWFRQPCGDDRTEAMLVFERQAAECGFARIAGVDEAGRGPLAGPIVAAAVVLGEAVIGLNDSKQLSEGERERLYEELQHGPHRVSVAIIGVDVIDTNGIQPANYAAMAQAAAGLTPSPDMLLVDGFAIRGCAIPQTPIVKGDRRSVSIAAASIVAKVTRDRIMVHLGREYPHYGFERHKGYATPEHLAALERYGPCPVHRKSFAPIATRADAGLLC